MTTIYITNSGMGAYLIDGVSNGTIALIRGNTYFLDINAYGHPFWIQTVPGGYTGYNIYTDGITNNGIESGTITFTFPVNTPSLLYYACQYHSSMQGMITISDAVTTTPITFDGFSRVFSLNGTFTISASSNSGGAFSYSTEDTDIITISGSTVTMLTAGNGTITATQAAYGIYGANSTTANFTIAEKITTNMIFSIPTRPYSTIPFTIQASSNRIGGIGVISYSTEDTDIITIENNTVTMLKLGTATIRATLPETDQYTSGYVEAIVSIIQNRVRISMISLYTNNAQVYYKPHSLAPCGVGSTRNYRIKSRKT